MEVCHDNHEQQTDFHEENLVHRDTYTVEWVVKEYNSNNCCKCQKTFDDGLQICALSMTSGDQ